MKAITKEITKREYEIVNALSQGLSSSEISEKLFISVYTVQTHRKNAMEKTAARNAAHLIRRFYELGLIGMS